MITKIECAMKKEIYITILLFAFMLFALISTMVRGQSLTAKTVDQISPPINNNTLINKPSTIRTTNVLNDIYGLKRLATITGLKVQFNELLNGVCRL